MPKMTMVFLAGLVAGAMHLHAETPAIRVLVAQDNPPLYSALPNGNADGFAVELLRELLRPTEWKLVFVAGPGARAEDCDVLLGVGTAETNSTCDFTDSYVSLRGALFVRKDDASIESMADAAGKSIAVMKDDPSEAYAQRVQPSSRIVATATYNEAFRLLEDGQVDAVVAYRLTGNALIKQPGFGNIRMVDQRVDKLSLPCRFAVRPGDKGLLELLNQKLNRALAEGTYWKIFYKWFVSSLRDQYLSRTIVVGGRNDFPPYEYLDEHGNPAGYNVDLTRAIAQAAGIDVKIVLKPRDEILQGLERGGIDMVEGMSYALNRDSRFDFSVPHQEMSQAVFERIDAPVEFKALTDLATRRVAVVRGSIAEEYAVQNGLGPALVPVGNEEDALVLLARKAVDCAFCPRIVGLYWINKHGWSGLRISGKHVGFTSPYCYAARFGKNADLLNRFDEGLVVLKSNGEYQRIQEKWFSGFEPKSIWTLVGRYSMWLLGIVAALSVVGIAWTTAMHRQVARKTEELKRSRQDFALLFENMPEGFARHEIICDAQGEPVDYRFLEINPAFERLTGLEAKNLIGRTVREVMPDTERHWIETYGRVVRTGRSERIEQYAREIGRYYEVHAFRCAPNQFAVIFSDVSDRKMAERVMLEREEYFRSLFEQAPLAYQSLDETGRIVSVNDAWSKDMGYGREEVLGRSFGDFIDPGMDVDFPARFAAFKKRGHINGAEFLLRRKDGTTGLFSIDGRIAHTVDGSFKQTHCILHDITEQRRTQRRLEEQLDELQRWQGVMIERETRVIELKREINELLAVQGKPPRYSGGVAGQ